MRERLENALLDALRRIRGLEPLRIDLAFEQMIASQAEASIAALKCGNREPGRTLLVSLGLMRDCRRRPAPLKRAPRFEGDATTWADSLGVKFSTPMRRELDPTR